MKYKIILASIIIFIACSAAYTQFEDRPANFETQHFEIKIVENYPSQGLLQAKTNVNKNEKRTMILRNDYNADLRKRCRILYKSSITSNPSPCNQLP